MVKARRPLSVTTVASPLLLYALLQTVGSSVSLVLRDASGAAVTTCGKSKATELSRTLNPKPVSSMDCGTAPSGHHHHQSWLWPTEASDFCDSTIRLRSPKRNFVIPITLTIIDE